MKTAEEILGNFGIGINIEFGRYKFLYETLKNMVEHTQKEAYNQAIEDAAENTACEYEKDYLTGEIDKQLILVINMILSNEKRINR